MKKKRSIKNAATLGVGVGRFGWPRPRHVAWLWVREVVGGPGHHMLHGCGCEKLWVREDVAGRSHRMLHGCGCAKLWVR